MRIKNHTPSHKMRNSKSLLSSTIEYIKNDLKREYSNDEKSAKQSKKNLNKNSKNKKNKISNLNSNNQDKINQKQSKSLK